MDDLQTINDLLEASATGDSPQANLENLLRRIREVFLGNTDNAAIWITHNREAGPDQAFVALVKDEVWVDTEKADRVDLPSCAMPYVLEIPEADPSRTVAHSYLAFSETPIAGDALLQATAKLVGKSLTDLMALRRETIIYSILNSYREDIFEGKGPIGRKKLTEVANKIAATFFNPQVWAILYDFRNWRNSRTGPLVVSVGDDRSDSDAAEFHARLDDQVRKLLEEDNNPSQSIGRSVTIRISEASSEVRVFVACASLASHREPDPIAGVPYIAILLSEDENHSLDARQQKLLERFVLEWQRVLRFKNSLDYMRRLSTLLREFLTQTTPADVASSVINFLAETFSATEVAVLERRGMFLSIIGQKNVPVKTMPPLHIPTTPARVCLVARTGRELYDANVRHEMDSYLAIVQATRSQFTVPLIWRGDLVGVLVLGLAVIDGLEPGERKFIDALAGYCAAAIAGSQRSADERAVTHMLGEVLTGAALGVRLTIERDQLNSEDRAELQGMYDLLDQCQSFIEKFRQAQAVGSKRGRIDLREALTTYERDPLVLALLQNHPGCSLKVNVGSEPIIANAYYEALHLALNNLVVNALEALESCPGTVTISLKKERVWFKANRQYSHYGVIEVADEGQGISPHEQSKIFDLFYTTKPKHLGSGLTIAENIAEGFGGRIELGSPQGEKGAVFSLWLPIAKRTQ